MPLCFGTFDLHFVRIILCVQYNSAVPRKSNFSLNVEAISDVVKQEKPKCIFLTSPNNPDGRYLNISCFCSYFF